APLKPHHVRGSHEAAFHPAAHILVLVALHAGCDRGPDIRCILVQLELTAILPALPEPLRLAHAPAHQESTVCDHACADHHPEEPEEPLTIIGQDELKP